MVIRKAANPTNTSANRRFVAIPAIGSEEGCEWKLDEDVKVEARLLRWDK